MEATTIRFLKSTLETLTVKRVFEVISEALLNMIYPEDVKCVFCSDELMEIETYPMCEDHKSSFNHIMGTTCIRCGRQLNRDQTKVKNPRCSACIGEVQHYKRAMTVTYYQGDVKRLLFRLKYGRQTYIAKFIALMMYEKIEDNDYDYLIPVPIHKKRLRTRGFNQSQLIAKYLSKHSNIPVASKIIYKTQNTPYLSKLSKVERQNTLKDAFKTTRTNTLKNKRLLIIDDIFTTGATVNAISEKLLELGPKEISILTFAVGDYTK